MSVGWPKRAVIHMLTVSILLVALDVYAKLATRATASYVKVSKPTEPNIHHFHSIYLLQKKDLNECSDGTNKCVINSDCNDTDGSYTCTCSPGYIGDGFLGCRRECLR